jgi:Secretion system C-terminal sorting domain
LKQKELVTQTVTNILAEKSRIVKSNRDGDYQVRASLTYSPVALPSGKITCVSKPSKVLNFKEDLSFEGMSVYPNPSTTGFLNIEVKDDLEGADLIVYNELGKIVYQYKIDSFSKRQTIDLRGETQAIFFVKVYHGIFEKVKKVFVVK